MTHSHLALLQATSESTSIEWWHSELVVAQAQFPLPRAMRDAIQAQQQARLAFQWRAYWLQIDDALMPDMGVGLDDRDSGFASYTG